jgi:hypothetical protein
MSVVLENHYDPSYEPSNSEIEEYGKWLGMEFPKHQALLWIAREGLKAALPDSWKACKSEKGELYYFNFRSGQSMWDHPMDSHFKGLFQTELAKLEQGGSQPADAVVADLPEKQMTVKRKSQAKKDDAAAAAEMSATADASAAGGANGKKREKAITFVSPPKTVEHLQPSPAQDALMSESALLPMAAATTSSTTATSAKGGPTDAAASAESATDGSRKPMSGMSKLAALKSLKGGPSSSAATTPTNATVTAAAAQRKPSPVPTSVKVEAASTLNATAPLAAIPSATTAALAPVKDPRSRSPPDIEVTAAPAPAIQIPADAGSSSSRSASPVTTASTTTPKSPAGVTAGVLTAAQKAELEKGARAHAAATAAMKRAQAEELARIEEAHAARKAELKAQHAAEVASLDAKIREAQSRNIADLAARKQQLAADLEREFAEIQQKLRAAQAARIERLNVEEQEDKSVSATTASMSAQGATSVQGAIMAAMASVPALLAECAATLSRAEADFEATLRSELIEQRVQRIQRDVEAAAADAHRGDMQRVDAEWKSKLAQVQSSCADQLQTLTSAHANKVSELARTTTDLTLSVERIRGERDTALAAARSANQEALRREAALHEDALHAAQTQYAQAVAKARLENEQRLQSVRQELLAEYLAAEAELRRKAKVEYDALVAGIGSFRSTTAAESGTSNSTGRGSAIAPPSIPAVRVEVPDVDSSQSTNRAESDTSTPSHQHDRRAASSGKPASMSADALAAAAAADAYMHGPLSMSSNETSPAARQRTLAENELQSGGGRPATPMTAALHPVDGKLSGDALRAAVVNVIRELVVESGFVARATESGSISAPPSMLEQTARTRETGTVMSPQHSVANVAGNATPPQRAVHPVDSDDNDISPIKSHQHGGSGNGYGSSQNLFGLVVGSSSHGHRQPVPPAFPHSLQEQKRLIQRERQRLDNAKSFLDRQQDGNDRQRAALKAARSKWKKDVRAAKAAGTSSSSRKAEVLRNVHALLDQQADMLAHDEAVLQESKLWLQTKEDRLTRLEDQLLRPINMNDSAATNGTAAETTAMLAAFLELEPPLPAHPPPPPSAAVASMSGSGAQKPHAHQQSPRRRSGSMRVTHADPHDVPPLASLLPRDVNREAGPHSSRKPSPTSVLAAPRQRSESRPPTPQAVVADALLRIETRLAEVTSLVKSTTTTTSDRERRHKHGGASQSATNSRSASASKEMALWQAAAGVAPASRRCHPQSPSRWTRTEGRVSNRNRLTISQYSPMS